MFKKLLALALSFALLASLAPLAFVMAVPGPVSPENPEKQRLI